MDASIDFSENLQFGSDDTKPTEETETIEFFDETDAPISLTEEQKEAIQNCENEICPNECENAQGISDQSNTICIQGETEGTASEEPVSEAVAEAATETAAEEATAETAAEEAEEAEAEEATTEETAVATAVEEQPNTIPESSKSTNNPELFKKRPKDSVKNKNALRKHTYKKNPSGGSAKPLKSANVSQRKKYLKKPNVIEANQRFKTLKQSSKTALKPIVQSA